MKGEFSICKSVNVGHKKKGKNDTIISIEAEKASDKIFNKNSEQCQFRENIVQHKRTIYDKPTANIIVNGESFSSKARNKTRTPTVTTFIQHKS